MYNSHALFSVLGSCLKNSTNALSSPYTCVRTRCTSARCRADLKWMGRVLAVVVVVGVEEAEEVEVREGIC